MLSTTRLAPDTCGHGKHRGGIGFARTYEILKDEVSFAVYADRFRIAPDGLFGGSPGQRGHCEIQRGEEIIPVKSKDANVLRRGDLLTIHLGGGGGYGDPAGRDRAAIDRDLADGLMSEDEADRAYSIAAE